MYWAPNEARINPAGPSRTWPDLEIVALAPGAHDRTGKPGLLDAVLDHGLVDMDSANAGNIFRNANFYIGTAITTTGQLFRGDRGGLLCCYCTLYSASQS